MANFRLKYIKKNERLNSSYKHDPTWKNKIKEIQNRFSEVIDNLKVIVPQYTNYTQSHGDHQWSPFWIAVIEVQLEFGLPGQDHDTEYEINPITLEIKLQEESRP